MMNTVIPQMELAHPGREAGPRQFPPLLLFPELI